MNSTWRPVHRRLIGLGVMPRQASWWVWLLTVVLLGAGLAGWSWGFVAAIGLSVGQVWFFLALTGTLQDISVQIRAGYAALLLICYHPEVRWLYWLPALGTSALLLFGYCLMARMVSLLPWNRSEPLSFDLLRRTFLSAPAIAHVDHRSACGGPNGVCELEARVASTRTLTHEPHSVESVADYGDAGLAGGNQKMAP